MERLPAAVDPRLRDGARQCAALLHRPVDHRALRGHHPGQSFPAAARGGLVGRALSRVPLGDSNRPTARAVPRLRREVEPLAMLVPGWPLALFRVAFGLLYLDMALQKAPWIDFGWLRSFIEKEIEHPAFPAVASFFKSVVLPNFTFFGYMTFVVELALGLGLLLGLLTRRAGSGVWTPFSDPGLPGCRRPAGLVSCSWRAEAVHGALHRMRDACGRRRSVGRRVCLGGAAVGAARARTRPPASPGVRRGRHALSAGTLARRARRGHRARGARHHPRVRAAVPDPHAVDAGVSLV